MEVGWIHAECKSAVVRNELMRQGVQMTPSTGPSRATQRAGARNRAARHDSSQASSAAAVSYTHLTLPTICSV
eukprot:1148109-Alexandrium_andersonii.AAC.1